MAAGTHFSQVKALFPNPAPRSCNSRANSAVTRKDRYSNVDLHPTILLMSSSFTCQLGVFAAGRGDVFCWWAVKSLADGIAV